MNNKGTAFKPGLYMAQAAQSCCCPGPAPPDAIGFLPVSFRPYPSALVLLRVATYLVAWWLLLFSCRAFFQWPIIFSEGAGSDRILVLLPGTHLVEPGSREKHACTVATVSTAPLPRVPVTRAVHVNGAPAGAGAQGFVSVPDETRTRPGVCVTIGVTGARGPRGLPSPESAIRITAMANWTPENTMPLKTTSMTSATQPIGEARIR